MGLGGHIGLAADMWLYRGSLPPTVRLIAHEPRQGQGRRAPVTQLFSFSAFLAGDATFCPFYYDMYISATHYIL
jgi:hypothetical protein